MDQVQLQIKRLDGFADLPLPRQMTEGSAGLDVCAGVDLEIEPGAIAVIRTGFAMALPVGWEAQIRPRSGLASKHGVTLINSPGTIDADYRGEVKIPLINHGQAVFTIERGMRIAQMVLQHVPRVEVKVVDELDATDRGTGGFGHSGV